MEDNTAREAIGDYKYGFHDPENATIRFDKGLSEQVVRDISELKSEPEWMTEIRVKAYRRFMEMQCHHGAIVICLTKLILMQLHISSGLLKAQKKLGRGSRRYQEYIR